MSQSELRTSQQSKAFISKIARSIAEIQPSVNNMADVVVFLEVLGYNDSDAQKYGFENLHSLGKEVYGYIDVFEAQTMVDTQNEIPVSSTVRRLKESITMVFPWLGSLVLLALTGVSLWMAWGLPADVTTVFLGGVFTGLAISEGLSQNLHRLFSFYYSQTNVGEVRRSIQRNYALAGAIICAVVGILFASATIEKLTFQLASIAAIAVVTISLHRLSFVVLYSLKKLRQISIAYLAAFALMLGIFFFSQHLIPDITARYLGALGSAFGLLSGFAAYYHHKLLSKSLTSIVPKNAPHFYSPLTVNDKTLASKYRVQLWESLPYFLYGSSYFIIIFADRILSWIFNPHHIIASNGITMPLAFNTIYHAGADLALIVIIPVAVLQYIMTEPIYTLAHNKAIRLKVWEIKKIDTFLRKRYVRVIASTVLVSITIAAVINLVVPQVVSGLNLNTTSSHILAIASAGVVMLSIFAANAIFMIFMARMKALAVISVVAACTVVTVGVVMAETGGFQDIVFGYVAGTAFAAVSSSIVMLDSMKKPTARLFARYI